MAKKTQNPPANPSQRPNSPVASKTTPAGVAAEPIPAAETVLAPGVSATTAAAPEASAAEATPFGKAPAPAAEPNAPLLDEAECVAKLPPLPTEERVDASYAAEQLEIIETEYSNNVPQRLANEPPPPPIWEPVPEPQTEAHQEPAYQGPSIPSLFIVHITPELAPVAKVGGLADVVFGLGNELEIRGNSVEIILPKYDCLRYDHVWGLCETFKDLMVPWYGGAIHCTVFFGFVHGRKCFFIEPHSADNFFNRGSIYGFNDDVMR